MLEYVDDAVMSTQNYRKDPQGSGGAMGLALGFGWSVTKFSFSWAALDMLRKGPKKGFYMPWTRFVPGAENRIANAGMKMGMWGTGGLFNYMPNKEALNLIRQRGVLGSVSKAGMGSIVRGLAPTMGNAAARRAAGGALASVIIGRTAGMALGVAGAGLFLTMGWDMARGIWEPVSRSVGKYWGLELGGYFPESQGAYTSRQRNLQAITASQLQARSAIGNEAMLFHR